MLAIDENSVPNALSVDWATSAPSHISNAYVSDKRDAFGGERAVVENVHQAPAGEVAETERCDNGDTNTDQMPVPSENINAHKPVSPKNLDLNEDELDTREETDERIVGHMQRNGRWHNVIR